MTYTGKARRMPFMFCRTNDILPFSRSDFFFLSPLSLHNYPTLRGKTIRVFHPLLCIFTLRFKQDLSGPVINETPWKLALLVPESKMDASLNFIRKLLFIQKIYTYICIFFFCYVMEGMIDVTLVSA